MVDVAALIECLLPFLSDRLQLDEGSARSLETTDGDKAQAIWDRLQTLLKRQEGLKMAIAQVAAKPESNARQAVLQEELETCFEADPGLARAIAQLMQPDHGRDGNSATIKQQAIGSQNQLIEQVSGSIVIGPGASSISIGPSAIQVDAAPPSAPPPVH